MVDDGSEAGAPRRVTIDQDTKSTTTTTFTLYPLEIVFEAKDVVTGIDETQMAAKTVTGVTYYNVAGMQSATPFNGVNIVVTRYSDGSTSSSKMMR